MDATYLDITGRGFVATSELKCLYGDLNTELAALFVSSTTIRCALPKHLTEKTGEFEVMISFAAAKRDKNSLLSITHHVGLPLPTLVSAKVVFSYIVDTFFMKSCFKGFIGRK